MKIICLGDSLTAGCGLRRGENWVELLREQTGDEWINAGVCGDTSTGILVRLQTEVLPQRPDEVLLMGGDNDIMLTGCADPYSVKTLRSSMGAVFRMPVWCTDAAAMRQRLTAAGLPLYGAALRDDTEDVRALDLRRCAIAIGSEGRGLTEQVLAMCDKTVRIPMQAHCESLNAAMAAAVLLWEAYR